MSSKIGTEQILTINLNINPRHITNDINMSLTKTLKKKLEGFCQEYGYVEKDSISIINRSIGEIKTINNQSVVIYNITYSCTVISPSKGDKLDIKVNSKTDMGIVGYLLDENIKSIDESPYLAIIPKEYFSDDKINDISIDDTITVEIEVFRIRYNSDKIHIVGRPV